jgi:uncharacterized Zn finger protein
MEKTLKARSSDGQSSYSVRFTFLEGSLAIDCDCPAGEFGRLCKHKLAFVLNREDMLFRAEQKSILVEVQAWVNQTNYPALTKQIDRAEVELKKARGKVKKAKDTLEIAMKHGTHTV